MIVGANEPLPAKAARQEKFVLECELNLRIVEAGVLAVRSMAGFAAAEVSRRNYLAVAFTGQQLDKPGFVLDFFVQDARGHVIGSRILSECHVAHRAPAANRAPLRLHQQGKNVYDGW